MMIDTGLILLYAFLRTYEGDFDSLRRKKPLQSFSNEQIEHFIDSLNLATEIHVPITCLAESTHIRQWRDESELLNILSVGCNYCLDRIDVNAILLHKDFARLGTTDVSLLQLSDNFPVRTVTTDRELYVALCNKESPADYYCMETNAKVVISYP